MSKRLKQLYEERKREIAPFFETSKTQPPYHPSLQPVEKEKRRPLNHSKETPSSPPKKEPFNPPRIKGKIELPLKRTRLEHKITPLEKFHQVYQEIKNKGLYITSSNELVYGNKQALPLDEASLQNLQTSKTMYNAGITFTILTSLLQDSSAIFFGEPGSGKTTLAEYISSAVFDLPLKQIQQATLYGHPELTEEKMIAMYDVIKMMNKEKKLIIRDFIKFPVRIIDEVNRIPLSKLSILYQLVDRGWTTYQDNMLRAYPAPLFATANAPDSGNFELPQPFLDRFDIGINVQDLDPYHYHDFTARRTKKIKKTLENKITLSRKISRKDLIQARKTIHAVDFPSQLMSYLAHFSAELKTCDMAGVTAHRKAKANALYKKPGPLCESCDHYSKDHTICSQTENSLSARTISSIYSYAKALAAWRGSNQVNQDDLKYSLAYSSWFKLTPTRKAFEDEPRYTNDRIEWVLNLYDSTKKTYEEITNLLPDYQNITQLVLQQSLFNRGQAPPPSLTRKEVKKLMEETAKLDSLAKFPLIVTLNDLYHKLK